ncbi:hypothetical protein [Parabacteroides sp. FAFU027]|uniref:hypothetical protein n=1 Tax=Parabacteroides sp. FAFU027 TaxID=2922715 RepID=UPI001FAF60E1|nr:hypothetical protein [Parabacteroides sp. FAFU027]
MIEYELPYSSFLVANRNYCENIEMQLQTLGADCNGYCNGFGYEIDSVFIRNNLTYNIKFIKYQTTQGKGDAHEYAGLELFISGINNKGEFVAGKSIIKRLFTPYEIKSILPKPYYMKFEDWSYSEFNESFAHFLLKNSISGIRLKEGKLAVKIHEPIDEIAEFITDIEKLIRQIP